MDLHYLDNHFVLIKPTERVGETSTTTLIVLSGRSKELDTVYFESNMTLKEFMNNFGQDLHVPTDYL